MKKLMLLLALGAGYVLGAKAGRGRYEQIRSTFLNVKDNPKVQEAAASAQATAKEQAPVVADKAKGFAAAAADKVKGDGKDDDLVEELHPDSTARQKDPYPQGDLP